MPDTPLPWEDPEGPLEQAIVGDGPMAETMWDAPSPSEDGEAVDTTELHERLVEFLMDRISAGEWVGWQSLRAAEKQTGHPIVVIRKCLNEAMRRLTDTAGTVQQQWLRSIAAWRQIVATATQKGDPRTARIAQEQVDRILATQAEHVATFGPSPEEQAERKKLVAMTTIPERRKHVAALIRSGEFGFLRTTAQLRHAWSDLSELEYTDVVASAAQEVETSRGTQMARRLARLAHMERMRDRAQAQGDLRLELKIAEVEAKTDDRSGESTLLDDAQNSAIFAILMEVLADQPDRIQQLHDQLAARDARLRSALLPAYVSDSADE